MPHFGTVAAARSAAERYIGVVNFLCLFAPVSLWGKEVKQSTVAWNVLTMA